jgi:RecG-like helicase
MVSNKKARKDRWVKLLSDKTIYLISLAIALFGIFCLFIFSFFIEYDEVNISSIDYSYIGRNVKVVGYVKSEPIIKNNVLLFSISDISNKSINVVMFNVKEKNISKNEIVIILGRIEEYKDNLEIVAKSIKKH